MTNREIVWKQKDYSRVPFYLYHDEDIYARERTRVFEGPTWSFLGLEAEIPRPGDFRRTVVGDIPVLLSRDLQGKIHAFVNRCAHRGSLVRRETSGNSRSHVCFYHRWCFALDGRLTGVPLRKGVRGEGGLDSDFDLGAHGLRRFRVGNIKGALFGTLSDQAEPLEAYLGAAAVDAIGKVLHKPVRILGYQRQRLSGNWKMYAENARDSYHAGLLHGFVTAFALDRATQKGGAQMDPRHRHNVIYAIADSDTDADVIDAYAEAKPDSFRLRLRSPSFLEFRRERKDDWRAIVASIFPGAVVFQHGNILGTRQLRLNGVDDFEVFQTLLAYEDDDEEMVEHRLLQGNLMGPAGFVAMEDGEAVENVSVGTRAQPLAQAVIEMGGRGPLAESGARATDVPLRGFWSYYAELMGCEPEGAIR